MKHEKEKQAQLMESSTNTDDVKISIVTACYNSVAFIDRIYGSLVRQTYKNFEWICVDDCSTDATVSVLAALSSPGDLGMQVYRLPQNTGGPLALAVGTQRARYEITTWLDHDDELFPDALENIRKNWPLVSAHPGLGGLTFRSVDPASGRMVGRPLTLTRPLSWSEGTNLFPDVTDGTFAVKTGIIKQYATVAGMENLVLNGPILQEMTASYPFVCAEGPSVRYYHRDNPESQTRLERISRKTVASYARLIDGADHHYLRRPWLWAKQIATMLRYSKLVHGKWFACLSDIRRSRIRALVICLWPLGLLTYARRPTANVTTLAIFPESLAQELPDLWVGEANRGGRS